MRIGFIGLGRTGAPMAARIEAAGHSVVGYDVSPARRQQGVPGVIFADGLAQVTAEKERRVNVLARQPAHSHARKTI
jgi:3-hydroxyisobutyrate dehydrogenase